VKYGIFDLEPTTQTIYTITSQYNYIWN